MCNKPTTLVRSTHAALQSEPFWQSAQTHSQYSIYDEQIFAKYDYQMWTFFKLGPFAISILMAICDHWSTPRLSFVFAFNLSLFPSFSFIPHLFHIYNLCIVVIDYQLSLWLFVIIGALSSFSLIIDRLLHPQQSLPSVSNISSPGSSSKYPLNLNVSRV